MVNPTMEPTSGHCLLILHSVRFHKMCTCRTCRMFQHNLYIITEVDATIKVATIITEYLERHAVMHFQHSVKHKKDVLLALCKEILVPLSQPEEVVLDKSYTHLLSTLETPKHLKTGSIGMALRGKRHGSLDVRVRGLRIVFDKDNSDSDSDGGSDSDGDGDNSDDSESEGTSMAIEGKIQTKAAKSLPYQ